MKRILLLILLTVTTHLYGTNLTQAVLMNDSDLVKCYLRQGHDVNEADGNGCTPLYYAVGQRNRPIARILLSNNANPNIKNKMLESSMEFAERMQYLEMLDMMEHGEYMKRTYGFYSTRVTSTEVTPRNSADISIPFVDSPKETN